MMNKIKQFFRKIGPARAIVLLIISFVLFVFLAFVFSTYRERQQPEYTIEYVDSDTGETVSTQPNRVPEKAGSDDQVVVLGAKSLYDIGSVGLTSAQTSLFSQDLSTNAVEKLPPHDQIIKVVNPVYQSSKNILYAELIYKEKVKPLSVEIMIDSIYRFTYVLKKDGSTIYSSKALVIIQDNINYGGDGVPPEEQP